MEGNRLSWRWIAVGAISIVGAHWLAAFALVTIEVDDAWLPYITHALGASLVGVTMMLHAPFRPWREPMIAGVLGVAVELVLLLLPRGNFGWVVGRSSLSWLLVLGLPVLSGLFAYVGAMVVRRTSLSRPSTAAVVILSAMVGLGVTMLVVQISTGVLPREMATVAAVLVFASLPAGSFVTQSVVNERRVWACSMGITFCALFGIRSWMDALSLIGAPLGIAFASIGARLYWRWYRRAVEPNEPEIPPARLQ